jgi:hypothetical protein
VGEESVGRLQRRLDPREGYGDEALSRPIGTMNRKTALVEDHYIPFCHRIEMEL